MGVFVQGKSGAVGEVCAGEFSGLAKPDRHAILAQLTRHILFQEMYNTILWVKCYFVVWGIGSMEQTVG